MSIAGLPPVPRSVVHMLLQAAEEFPDRPAVTYGDITLSYAGYRQAVLALAKKWRPYVRKGDRVALPLANSLEMAVGMFAAHLLGAQAMPLNPGYTERELIPILDDSAPVLLVHDGTAVADMAVLCERYGIERISVTGDGSAIRKLADS